MDGRIYICGNGHPVVAGSEFCGVCSLPVAWVAPRQSGNRARLLATLSVGALLAVGGLTAWNLTSASGPETGLLTTGEEVSAWELSAGEVLDAFESICPGPLVYSGSPLTEPDTHNYLCESFSDTPVLLTLMPGDQGDDATAECVFDADPAAATGARLGFWSLTAVTGVLPVEVTADLPTAAHLYVCP